MCGTLGVRRDGIAVKMNVADAYGLDVAASKACRHGQYVLVKQQ
jgi:hypothetical protein